MSQENRGGKLSLSDLRDKQKSESQQTQPRINTRINNNRKSSTNQYSSNTQNRPNNYNNSQPVINARLQEIMKGIKEKGYCENGSNILRKDLLSNEANQIVEQLSKISDTKKRLTTTQLRSFFGEVKKLSFKYEGNKMNEEINSRMVVDLLILKSKVEYKKDKISPEFRFFMNENLDIVINEGTIESYNNFVILFEVIIGLLYGKGQIDNK